MAVEEARGFSRALVFIGLALLLEQALGCGINIREGCKRIFVCQTDRTGNEVTIQWRRFGGGGSVIPSSKLKMSEENGVQVSSLIFDPITKCDGGRYVCDIGGDQTQSYDVGIVEGPVSITNITRSMTSQGTIVKCVVDSCLPDVVIQFFRGPDLLYSTTERLDYGYVGTLRLKSHEIQPGHYAVRAISEYWNIVVKQDFTP